MGSSHLGARRATHHVSPHYELSQVVVEGYSARALREVEVVLGKQGYVLEEGQFRLHHLDPLDVSTSEPLRALGEKTDQNR